MKRMDRKPFKSEKNKTHTLLRNTTIQKDSRAATNHSNNNIIQPDHGECVQEYGISIRLFCLHDMIIISLYSIPLPIVTIYTYSSHCH